MAEPTRPTAGVHAPLVAQADALPQGPATTQEAGAPSGDAARPSLVSRGKPPPGTPLLDPWFLDDDRLLAKVITRAGEDPDFALRVMRAVGHAAGRSRRLRAELDEAAKSSKPGAQSTPHWVFEWLLDSYNAGRASGMSAAEAHNWLAEMHGRSVDRITSMLTEARKRRAVLESQ